MCSVWFDSHHLLLSVDVVVLVLLLIHHVVCCLSTICLFLQSESLHLLYYKETVKH